MCVGWGAETVPGNQTPASRDATLPRLSAHAFHAGGEPERSNAIMQGRPIQAKGAR